MDTSRYATFCAHFCLSVNLVSVSLCLCLSVLSMSLSAYLFVCLCLPVCDCVCLHASIRNENMHSNAKEGERSECSVILLTLVIAHPCCTVYISASVKQTLQQEKLDPQARQRFTLIKQHINLTTLLFHLYQRMFGSIYCVFVHQEVLWQPMLISLFVFFFSVFLYSFSFLFSHSSFFFFFFFCCPDLGSCSRSRRTTRPL